MTLIEEHKKKIKEHLEEINDAIEQEIEKKPVTIGFHCSACSLQYLELYLHVTNKIQIGKIIKHDWFKRPKPEQKKEPLIERKLLITFPKKDEIYNLIYTMEKERTSLLYGKPTKEQIESILQNFQKLKELFIELFKNEKFEI